MTELHLVVDYRGSLRQAYWDFESLDLDILRRTLDGFNIECIVHRAADLINATDLQQLRGHWVWMTSSQVTDYKSYLDDLAFTLSTCTRMVPSYPLFRAHENKGYQEILKNQLGIDSVNGAYFGTLEEFELAAQRVRFPAVLKFPEGAHSCNVHKVESADQVRSVMHRRGLNLLRAAKRRIKTTFFLRRYSPAFKGESDYTRRFVLQPMVVGSDYDWKVLVFGRKYYALRRGVRKNDFRASGSGKFEFVPAPAALLDYAKHIASKIDTPFISLDIIEQNGECALLEFQATHFGPITIMNSPHYYTLHDESWQTINETSVLEEEYARAIGQYIHACENGPRKSP
jgi:hypothetical protein